MESELMTHVINILINLNQLVNIDKTNAAAHFVHHAWYRLLRCTSKRVHVIVTHFDVWCVYSIIYMGRSVQYGVLYYNFGTHKHNDWLQI